MLRFRHKPVTTGGTGGPEVDPVATPLINSHKNATDPHGDRAAATTALTTHKGAADHDTHNDARYEVHGAVTTHTGAADPHGDRNYADTRIAALVNAAPAALDTLAEIDAQLSSDEAGAAAMQASINSKAAASDLTAHLNDPTAAHAASAVSVTPAGLVVVTGTDVQAALAQLDARAAAQPQFDQTGITDGEQPVWNAAQGKYLPGMPNQQSELRYAANTTAVVTAVAFGNAAVDIPGVTFTVPIDARNVWLSMVCTFQQSVIGDGDLNLWCIDVTGGGSVTVYSHPIRLPNTVTAGIKTVSVSPMPFRIGPVAAPRTFKMQATITTAGSVNILNSASFPTWMKASV